MSLYDPLARAGVRYMLCACNRVPARRLMSWAILDSKDGRSKRFRVFAVRILGYSLDFLSGIDRIYRINIPVSQRNQVTKMEDLEKLADLIAIRMTKAEPTGIAFERLAIIYMENYAKVHKKTWLDDDSRLRLHLLPVFTGRDICSITKLQIVEFHKQLGKDAPYAANRSLEQLSKMLGLAQDWGLYPEDRNLPTKRIKPFPEYTRDRFISTIEMDRLAASIAKVRGKRYQILFWLYLLTGLRKTELLAAKWSDLDLERWEIKVPAIRAKNGRPHYLPLPPEAMALFASLDRSGDYIFTGGKPNSHLHKTTVYRVWDRVRKQAGIEDVRIHDLRRTTASWLAQSGHSLPLVGKCLNHSGSRATDIYARFALQDVRTALESHGQVMSKYIG